MKEYFCSFWTFDMGELTYKNGNGLEDVQRNQFFLKKMCGKIFEYTH